MRELVWRRAYSPPGYLVEGLTGPGAYQKREHRVTRTPQEVNKTAAPLRSGGLTGIGDYSETRASIPGTYRRRGDWRTGGRHPSPGQMSRGCGAGGLAHTTLYFVLFCRMTSCAQKYPLVGPAGRRGAKLRKNAWEFGRDHRTGHRPTVIPIAPPPPHEGEEEDWRSEICRRDHMKEN